jgi:hypothetical protein
MTSESTQLIGALYWTGVTLFFITGVLFLSIIKSFLMELRRIDRRAFPAKKYLLAFHGFIVLVGVVSLVFAISEYREAQQDRKQVLNKLRGIDSSLNARITEAATEHRISFSYTYAVERDAQKACLKAKQSGDPIATSPGCQTAELLEARHGTTADLHGQTANAP